MAAAQRHRDRAGAGAARGHRLHLRVAPQRHRRRRRPLPEVRQRGDPARRQGGDRVQRAASPQCWPRRSRRAGLPPDAIQVVRRPPTARRSAAMLALDALIDLIIPRGGEAFVRWVAERSQGTGAQARQGARATSTSTALPIWTWPRAIVRQRQGAAAERVQRARDAAGRPRRRRPRSCRWSRRAWPSAGVELRGRRARRWPACRARVPPSAADWDEEYLD